jgi:Family of unknown function (DUF695)
MRKPNENDSPSGFGIVQASIEGYPLIGVIDMCLRGYASKDRLPWFLSVSAPLCAPTSSGLPSPDEAAELDRWQSAIERELRATCSFVFVGRVSWNGNRELLYYVDGCARPTQRLQSLIDGGTSRLFAFNCERDDDWEAVAMYWESRAT